MFKFLNKLLFTPIPLTIFILGIAIGFYLMRYSYTYLIQYPSYRNSYISIVNSNVYGNKILYNYLDEFNKMGYNKIITYSEDSNHIRPIFIEDGKLKDPILGEAYVTNSYCMIYLTNKLTLLELKYVLWHEILHCFGYEHTKIKSDLMYFESDKTKLPSKSNVESWAKKLCVFLYNKNECR